MKGLSDHVVISQPGGFFERTMMRNGGSSGYPIFQTSSVAILCIV